MHAFKVKHEFRQATPIVWVAIWLLVVQSALCQEKAPAEVVVPDPPKYEHPVLIPIEGEIGALLEFYVNRKLDEAKAAGADLIIFEINSPGGELKATLDMAKRLLATDWAHTVAYVPRGSEAISGAAVFSLGCNDIVMHVESQMGDAGVIYLLPDGTIIQAKEKIASYAKQIRDLAEHTGRSPDLAEAMMDSDHEVFKATNKVTNEVRFVSDLEAKRLQQGVGGDDWVVDTIPVEESKKGRFLMVNGKRALELQLARANVDDFEGVKRLYNLTKDPVTLAPRWVDTFAFVLNTWFVTFLLILIGLVCLYVEFSAPGIGIGGILAVVCFMLFFWSRYFGGTADVLDIMLFLGGIACLAIELFILPGFGVFGLTGVLLMIASLLLASQTFVIPSNAVEMKELTGSAGVLAGAMVAFGITAVFLSRNLRALPMLSRLALQPPTATDTHKAFAGHGEIDSGDGDAFAIVAGARGKAHTSLRPHGKARFGDQYLNVHAEDDIIRPGTLIEIVEIAGSDILVRRVDEADA